MTDSRKLAQAQKYVVQLRFESALRIYYDLLNDAPSDVSLFERILKLEMRKANLQSWQKLICHLLDHPVLLASAKHHLKTLMVDYQRQFSTRPELNPQQMRALINTFEYTELPEVFEDAKDRIKSTYAEHSLTPGILLLIANKLQACNNYLASREILTYLLQFYGETDEGKQAIKLLKQAEELIK